MRASASGVSGGRRPFSGSVISEVRLVPTTDVLCSVQKLLYPPTLPPAGSGSVRTSLGAFSRSTRSWACRSIAATSSGLRNACSARFCGRSRGVMVPLFQIAWISGWPHGVRGAVQPGSGAWACAWRVAGARVTSASTVTNAAGSLTIRWVISTSSPVRRRPSRRPESGSCRMMPRRPRPGSACRTATRCMPQRAGFRETACAARPRQTDGSRPDLLASDYGPSLPAAAASSAREPAIMFSIP